ncbi:hypothetical protein BKA70DRAFT_1217765 [Coprinopsis sp. MPI-PUGE-AT-0042]|nr:hypothetical protein BKA70DRAFT_1217765 [Coprinopsis sp. MPI-PUGE-AT-0042]
MTEGSIRSGSSHATPGNVPPPQPQQPLQQQMVAQTQSQTQGGKSSLVTPVNPTLEEAILFNGSCYVAHLGSQIEVPAEINLTTFPEFQHTVTPAGNQSVVDANEIDDDEDSVKESDLVKLQLDSDLKKMTLFSSSARPKLEATSSQAISFPAIYKIMVDTGYNIPITGFTNVFLEAKACSPKFKYTEVVIESSESNAKGKIHILNWEQFKKEEDITVAKFYEAYINFLKFLSTVGNQNVVNCFCAHYNILSSHPRLHSLWSHIHNIDIWYQNHFFATHKDHPTLAYNLCITALETIAINETQLSNKLTELEYFTLPQGPGGIL